MTEIRYMHPERTVGTRCNALVGGGVVSFPCTLPQGHADQPSDDPEPHWAQEASKTHRPWHEWRRRQEVARGIAHEGCEAGGRLRPVEGGSVYRCDGCGEMLALSGEEEPAPAPAPGSEEATFEALGSVGVRGSGNPFEGPEAAPQNAEVRAEVRAVPAAEPYSEPAQAPAPQEASVADTPIDREDIDTWPWQPGCGDCDWFKARFHPDAYEWLEKVGQHFERAHRINPVHYPAMVVRGDDLAGHPEPTKTRPEDQPLPTADEARESDYEQLVRDIRSREALGVQRYGQSHRGFNGRNTVMDAYEETIDQALYLRSLLTMADASREDVVAAIEQTLNDWFDEEVRVVAEAVADRIQGWIVMLLTEQASASDDAPEA